MLATRAGIIAQAINDFEAGRRETIIADFGAAQRALEAAGIEFTNGDAPGVRLRKSDPTGVG